MLYIREQHYLTAELAWITLEAPQWASAQAGQFAMVRCAPSHGHDPFLRERFWLAGVTGDQVSLLVPTTTVGGAWLAAAPVGTAIDALGPLGHAVELKRQAQAVLVLTEGATIGATLIALNRAIRHNAAVVLLASAPEAQQLPPYILPPEIEYQATSDDVLSLLDQGGDRFAAPLLWADAILAAGSSDLALRLAQRIRKDRFNWKPGLAQFVLDLPLPCGVGLCGGCWHNGRKGDRLVCLHGPTFDLRDVL